MCFNFHLNNNYLLIEFEFCAKFLKIIAAVNRTLLDNGLKFANGLVSIRFAECLLIAINAALFA